SGDSDVLWCEFLMAEGVLDRAAFEARNDEMARRYQAATVTAREFCEFYVGTLAGRSPPEWRPWCERFLAEVIVPRIPASALALIDTHRARGDRVVLTTATNRLITEPTAQHLRIDDLIATEVEIDADGCCTGRTAGTLNMRQGKVARLREWLAGQRLPESEIGEAVLYSDSSNDLPLLDAVGEPVAVDPDDRLRAHALAHGWRIITLARGAHATAAAPR
ncbi:MAG: HAD-IB family hydrolase, partial [Caldimonas sp.]